MQALALLTTSTKSPLSSVVALLPIPSPAGYLEHVAQVAHDLAKACGDESQGVRSRIRRRWPPHATDLTAVLLGFVVSH